MRILLVNPNTSLAVTDAIVANMRQAASPGTEIVPVTARFGARIVGTRAESAIADHAALDALAHYAPGCDAAIVASGFDNAMRAGREMLSIPVLGLTEAALHIASLVGGRIGVVVIMHRVAPMVREMIEAYGFGPRLAGMRVVPGQVINVLQEPEAMADLLAGVCKSLVEDDGAEAIVLVGAVMGPMPARIQARVPVPVIEGLTSAIVLAESLVRLKLMKPQTGSYAAVPTQEQVGLSPALTSLFG